MEKKERKRIENKESNNKQAARLVGQLELAALLSSR
jgi:hypothetical protein